MSDFNDLERLIRLKRYERPPKDYYERFFSDFQERQRSEMLRQSAHGLFFERVSTWLWGFGKRRWLYAGGAAYAAVIIVIFLKPMSERFAPSDGPESVILEMKVPAPGANGQAENSDELSTDALPSNEKGTQDRSGKENGIREL